MVGCPGCHDIAETEQDGYPWAVAHLHWWLTPRFDQDRRPRGPIWEDLDFLRDLWTGGARPEPDDARALRRRLLDALGRQRVTIEVELVR